MSRSATASNVQSTPSSRVNAEVGLDERARNRVRNADPSCRCLVENCVETKAVEFCHCFPRRMSYAKNRHVLDSIEWFWNMRHCTLNLDTRRNIFRAGASWHYLFDQQHWMLLPTQEIVKEYHDSLTSATGRLGRQMRAHRESFPIIPDLPRYEYRFIPISREMVKIPLIRQNDDPNAASLTIDDITIHLHPFPNMPVLESHLHPKFVILESGRKLKTLDDEQLDHLEETNRDYSETWSQILDIYAAWTAPLPIGAYNDQSFDFKRDYGDGNNQEDDQSDRTASRRVQDPNARKRPRQEESPTPAPRQEGQGQQTLKRAPSLCLSKKSVELHDEKSGEIKWTDDAVRDWRKQCHPLPESIHVPWNPEICV